MTRRELVEFYWALLERPFGFGWGMLAGATEDSQFTHVPLETAQQKQQLLNAYLDARATCDE